MTEWRDAMMGGAYFDADLWFLAVHKEVIVGACLCAVYPEQQEAWVDIFHQMVRDHPEIAQTLLKHLAGRVRLLADAVEDLALHTVRTRLARCLLSRTNGDAPPKYWSHDELAAHCVLFLIQRERGRVVVTDLAGLRREALREQKPRYARVSA